MDDKKTTRCCAYDVEGVGQGRGTPVTGHALHPALADSVLDQYTATRLYLITVVHVAGRRDNRGQYVPIVDREYIDTMFRVANSVWSQACIRLVPYFTGTLVTTFDTIPLLAKYGNCLATESLHLVEPYDVTAPGTTVINLYVLHDTDETGRACGSHVSGRVFLRTGGLTVGFVGNTLAHEIGHVLLNPLGAGDNANPDHLMFHADQHPETSPGSMDGLFLSDCLGARTRALHDLFAFARPGGLGSSGEPVACRLRPSLGNNMILVDPGR